MREYNRKIQALANQRQVGIFGKAEATAREAEAEFNRLIRDLTALVMSGSNDPHAADTIVSATWARVRKNLWKRFETLAEYGYNQTREGLRAHMPRSGFSLLLHKDSKKPHHQRRVRESLQEAKVSDLFPIGDDDEPGIEINAVAQNVAEMTQEEYMREVERYLMAAPTKSEINKWIVKPAPDGLDWETRLKSWDKQSRDSIRRVVVQGFSEGESVTAVRKRIEAAVAMPRYAAQRIARTEGCRIGNAGAMQAYEAVGDIIWAFEYTTLLDNRTRKAHRELNGRLYRRDKHGVYRDEQGNVLPLFPNGPNCRCYANPKFLGIDKVEDVDSSAFAGISGQWDYGDATLMSGWWKRASEGAKKTLIGVKRYRSLKRRLKREPEWADVVGA